MKPRAFYRWKSFWLGVMVLGFLTWAWWDSIHWESYFCYGQKYFRQAGSGICLADRGYSMGLPPEGYRLPLDGQRFSLWSTEGVLWREVRFDAPEMLHVSGDPEPLHKYRIVPKGGDASVPRNAAAVHFGGVLSIPVRGAWAIYIPHWLVMVCFAVPWVGFIWWRGRRERKACP
ncbi:hypothetical protein WKV53_14545 [Luteolibacter sp. Y139]|uniref:DUF3592 domain-containing protein n=1 Tax=Luteolibacter soli TaxID=3135280 RepID=A0ABU9AVF5_9BACT